VTALLWAVAIVAVAAFGWGTSVVYRAHRSVVRRSEGLLSATGRTRVKTGRNVAVVGLVVGAPSPAIALLPTMDKVVVVIVVALLMPGLFHLTRETLAYPVNEH
jgi:hypothetical protein